MRWAISGTSGSSKEKEKRWCKWRMLQAMMQVPGFGSANREQILSNTRWTKGWLASERCKIDLWIFRYLLLGSMRDSTCPSRYQYICFHPQQCWDDRLWWWIWPLVAWMDNRLESEHSEKESIAHNTWRLSATSSSYQEEHSPLIRCPLRANNCCLPSVDVVRNWTSAAIRRGISKFSEFL